MGRLTTQERAEVQHLDASYREAWAHLLLRVNCWQSLEGDPNTDGTAVQKARDAAERAEALYRQSRNALAEYLLPSAMLAKQLVKC